MMTYRVGIRICSEGATGIDLPEVIPVFHRWIQRGIVDGPLVDVADYSHVNRGPGIVLIAFDANYAIDILDGRLGLTWYRKRPSGLSLKDTLTDGARRLVALCVALEAEPEFCGRLKFRADTITLFSNDRLLAPNTVSTEEEWRPVLHALGQAMWGTTDVQLERLANDARERFSVVLRSAGPASLHDLFSRGSEH